MQGLRAAIIFLTRLPAGHVGAGAFAAAPWWFPVVGLGLGAAQGAALVLVSMVWGPVAGGLVALLVGLALTGALHEDGLADTFDALGAPRPAERALEIMRDSRIGSYGALALIWMFAAQLWALSAIAGPWAAVAGLVAGQALSRACLGPILRHGPYLRAQGTGTGMTAPPGAGALGVWAGAVALALGVAVAGFGLVAAVEGLAGAGLGAAVIWLWARRRLGGVTGDVLGAAQQVAFLFFLLGVMA